LLPHLGRPIVLELEDFRKEVVQQFWLLLNRQLLHLLKSSDFGGGVDGRQAVVEKRHHLR